jgi:hypothetical protein
MTKALTALSGYRRPPPNNNYEPGAVVLKFGLPIAPGGKPQVYWAKGSAGR